MVFAEEPNRIKAGRKRNQRRSNYLNGKFSSRNFRATECRKSAIVTVGVRLSSSGGYNQAGREVLNEAYRVLALALNFRMLCSS